MKIGLAKLGCDVYLRRENWRINGGANAFAAVYQRLVDTGHDVTLLCNHDLGEDLPANVRHLPALPQNRHDLARWSHLEALVVFAGVHANSNLAMDIGIRKVQPILDVVNGLRVPWAYILTDHRYFPRWHDLHHPPLAIVTQVGWQEKRRVNFTPTAFNYHYGATELYQFYLEPHARDIRPLPEREVPLVIVCHDHHGEKECLKKERVWGHTVDQLDPSTYEVYGRWSVRSGPSYKGEVHRTRVMEMLQRGRASFLVPIAHGWITPRFYECCHAGTVPVLYGRGCPGTYDVECRSGIPLDSPWRVETADELVAAVARIDEEHQHAFASLVPPSAYNGTVIDDNIVGLLEGRIVPEWPPIATQWPAKPHSMVELLTVLDALNAIYPADILPFGILGPHGTQRASSIITELGEYEAIERFKKVLWGEVPSEKVVPLQEVLP